jgi:signal transduction histidine kinase/FixJ family two-component response regulator
MSRRFWDILGYNIIDLDFEEKNKENYIESDQIDYVKKVNSSLVPVSWNSMVVAEDLQVAEEAFMKHIETKGRFSYNVKIRYRHKEGHYINVWSRGNVVEWLANGKPWRMIGVQSDITKISNYDAVMAKYKFVSRMSHEIRTPLAVIISTLDGIDDEDTEVNINNAVDVLRKSSRQLLRISNNVLSLSQLENKKSIQLNWIGVNIIDEIKSVVSELKDSKKGGCKILISEDSDLPHTIYCDISKIRQIITNVLSNSIKFSPNMTPIFVNVECLEKNKNTAKVKICIKDQGIGIPIDKWKEVFNEFDQGSSTMIGSGLGLYISKCLTEIIGGKLEIVSSEPNNGTEMDLTFTAKRTLVKEDQNVERVTYLKHDYLISFKFHRILIVDDVTLMRSTLSNQIDRVAYCKDTLYASNGLEAVEIFDENEGAFDIIFMDVLMPVMNGFQACRRIKDLCAKNDWPNVPVVAVTASISENIHTECDEAGMDYVIFKPYTKNDLVNVIKKIIIQQEEDVESERSDRGTSLPCNLHI